MAPHNLGILSNARKEENEHSAIQSPEHIQKDTSVYDIKGHWEVKRDGWIVRQKDNFHLELTSDYLKVQPMFFSSHIQAWIPTERGPVLLIQTS